MINIWVVYTDTNLQQCYTFELIVEGHCGIRNPLPVHAVQNSAHDREAHHTEDGLHTVP